MANRLELYTCKVCTKTFSRLCKLQSHMHEHTTENIQIFWDIFSPLPDYIDTQQYGERKSFGCTVCTESSVNEDDFVRNMQLIHEDEAKEKTLKRRGVKRKAYRKKSDSPKLIRNESEMNVDIIYFECDAQQYEVRKPSTCSVCNESFVSEDDLERHFQLIHEDKGKEETFKIKVSNTKSNKVYFECEVCKQRLTQKSSLRSHLRKHTGERPYKCIECKKTFTFYQCLWNHTRKHTGEKKFKCDQCTKRYVYYQSLWSHKKLHSNEKPYVCTICGIKFALACRLKHHLIRQHTNEGIHTYDEKEMHHDNSEVSVEIHSGVKPFECMLCKRRFGSNLSLQSHKMQHTNNISNKYKVLQKALTESHKIMGKSARLKNKKLQQCDTCNKIFTYTKCLIKHLEKHEIEKCNKCSICGKEFAKYADLKSHLSLHTGERPYVCLVCGMSFVEYFDLWKHRKEHTSDKTYECNVCGKTFSQLSNLNSHIRVHSTEDPSRIPKRSDLRLELETYKKEPEEIESFQGKSHKKKKENSTHHTTHTRKRSRKNRFKCKDCERKFKYKACLTRHCNTKHKHRNESYNNKRYTCEQCGAVFVSEDDIINHQKCINCMKCGKEFKCSYLFCFHNSPHLCQSSSQELVNNNEGSDKPLLRENYLINAVNEIKESSDMDHTFSRNQEELDSLDRAIVDKLDYNIVASSSADEGISEPLGDLDAVNYSDYLSTGNCIETCSSSGEWLRFQYKSVFQGTNNNIGTKMSDWENMYIIENTGSTSQEFGVWGPPYPNKAACTYHHMEHYAIDETHPCVICGLVFSTITDLTTHAMGHITIV